MARPASLRDAASGSNHRADTVRSATTNAVEAPGSSGSNEPTDAIVPEPTQTS